ncbi:hypothetical protein AGABI2DRAFT_194530 [Agaricus bisporus var. bisporus H97]|uniref:hypothetical protein n=1 Tax=Agaricus bisporus var. bisporus (strain H97 / ATCC MYA-4626 / FGSC 10389) TaxID=936046 RepID=UPI00029F7BA9|nr:hypothetical protein AGABI2DRAFT_194530 [Agaricus bisporus var. bisporus H97]EKV44513.1 hypothetical protein AGABI2DRAFT_194530 [Agaricus bisporus var. bisporus H97]
MVETEKSRSSTLNAYPLPYRTRSRRTALPDPSFQDISSLGSEAAEMTKDFEDLAKFSEASLVYSGFIIALVIAFLALANKVSQKMGDIEIEAAMTLCFLAASCHLSIILVSSRACIVTYQYSQVLKKDRSSVSVKAFRKKLEASLRTLCVCEWIQGFGQTIMVPSLLYTIWLMFEHRILVFLIYGFIILLEFVIHFAGFWRVCWGTTTLRPLERYLRRFRRRTRENVEGS